MACSNMAHVAAAAGPDQDELLGQSDALKPNIAVITAYNDMLSAHQPFENYPALIAQRPEGEATAQVAGGVPAMCDGVTQAGLAWSYPCSAAILSPCQRLLAYRIMYMMPLYVWGCVIKLYPVW